MTTRGRLDSGVTVQGKRAVTITNAATARERFEWATREFTIRCHSGRVTRGRWSGVPVGALVEAAHCSPETTHLLVTARDGFAVCVSVEPAFGGLLALVREEVEVSGSEEGESPDGTPRFLSPRLDSTETVRNVESIRSVTVPPGEDPLEHATDG